MEWLNSNFHASFSLISRAVEAGLSAVEALLLALPPWAVIPAAALVALAALGWRMGLFVLVCLGFGFVVGLWTATMQTIVLVTVAVVVAVAIAFPLGILTARLSAG